MKLPLKLNNNNDIYYNCNKCYSYNMFLNIITGGRGIGKTTTFLIKGLQDASKGNQFIYLRRYKPELKEFVDKNSIGGICDGIVTKGTGKGDYNFIYEDEVVGYGLVLSTARKYKSTRFDKVSLIIYDECVLAPGTYKYLPNEVETFLEFVSTVQRTRTNLKVVLMGNNEDLFNPFNTFFKIPEFDKIYIDKQRGIYCEHAKHSPQLLELEKKTPLHKLIAGTTYGDYHYENKILNQIQGNVIIKPNSVSLFCRCVINDDTLNIYHWRTRIGELRLFVERKKKVILDNITYEIMRDGKLNYYYGELFRKKMSKYISRFYFNGLVDFSDEQSINLFNWIIENI